jgi:hypothetical protein
MVNDNRTGAGRQHGRRAIARADRRSAAGCNERGGAQPPPCPASIALQSRSAACARRTSRRGQWTRAGTNSGIRLAAGEKAGLGALLALALHLAFLTIEAYRSKNGLRDLFNRKIGTVAWTKLDGKDVFGANSRSPTYTNVDRVAAEKLRDTLARKHPDLMGSDNIGRMPNNTVFHAETTVLLRAARENGGTLAGRSTYMSMPRCATAANLYCPRSDWSLATLLSLSLITVVGA